MEQAMDQISSSLKEIQVQLGSLGKAHEEDKYSKVPVKTNNMLQGLLTQISAMASQLEKLLTSLKNAQGISCNFGEDAKSQGRRNADYLDDLDKKV